MTKTIPLERKFYPWLVAGVVAALVILSALVVYALYQGRSQYIASAKESSQTIADLLQANLHANIRGIDLTLRRAEVEFQRLHAQGGFQDGVFSEYLRGLKDRIPDAASIRATNREGLVVYGEGIDLANIVVLQANATGKEMFERAQTTPELFFGLPVKSRISGQWVLPVARALHLPDGAFGGLVYANINTDHIAKLFAALSADTHGEVTLFDQRRRVLHQSPAPTGAEAGVPFRLDPGIETQLFNGQQVAAYLAMGTTEDLAHIVQVNAITPYPVFVAVRVDVVEVLAQWRRRAQGAVVSVLILYAMAGLMLLAVRRAIQRQQLAQDQLQRQTELLDEVINQLPFGVVAYDAQRRMRLRNRKFGELLQYPEELLQRPDLHLADVVDYGYARGDYGYAESQDAVLNRFLERMAARQPMQFERRQPDGTYIEFRGIPISSNWTLLTYTDISAHKASEQSLRQAREAADSANQVKSNFLAAMSHEIRTPMNGVLGMLKLLQHTELSLRQLDYTKKAEGATHALLGIINDILDFSKVEAGKLELHNEPVVLGEVMRDLSVILSSSVAHKDVEVLFALAADVPPVLLCDGLRLRQILLNLAGNAIKFTEQGEVVLGLRVLQRQSDQVALEFSVRDTGIGIAADKLSHIFEAFGQAEASTTRRFGGTGLGLAISQQLVALMGGTLAVESVLGQGSRFNFSVSFGIVQAQPGAVAPVDPVAPAGALATSVPGGRGLRVLIVDDNALARQVLHDMAVAMGWQVDTLASGAEALQRLGADDNAPRYDLVLMDWRMPGMDGWEATRRIRLLKQGGTSPVVIMVTAAGRELLAEKARHETDLLDGYLVKPITASMLYEAVADAMDERQGERRVHLPQQVGERLRGLRLLVVEDNVLNQQIAEELLLRNGAQVEIAVCGLDGVEQALAADPPFDAILMDMQMPDIDGLEATRRLRAHAAMRAVPIIAMTANAMQADKQACLDAGMVDHISKPFDLEHLITTIVRHAAPRAGVSGGVPAVVIDRQAAIARLGGSSEFYDKVVASFREEAAVQLADLQRFFAQSDYHHAMHRAHTLRGLAGTVGALGLSARAGQLETQVNRWQDVTAPHRPSPAEIAAMAHMLDDLERELAQTLVALDVLEPPPRL